MTNTFHKQVLELTDCLDIVKLKEVSNSISSHIDITGDHIDEDLLWLLEEFVDLCLELRSVVSDGNYHTG
jgi:hypothetical protein